MPTTSTARGRHAPPAGPVARLASRLGGALALAVLATTFGLLVVPRAAGWQPIVVTSGSMGAAVPTGSVVLVRPVPAAAVRVGEVLLMRRGDGAEPVLHRVVERTATGVRTKGDANPAADPAPYPLRGTAWVAALHVPWAGYGVAALRSATGWAVVALLVAAAVGQAVVGRVRRARRADAQPVPA